MTSILSLIGIAAGAFVGSNTVTISGEIAKPSELTVQKPTCVRTLLRNVGTRETADLKHVEIVACDGTIRVVDATRLDKKLLVKPGETIRVPAADPATHVFVKGAVFTQGPVEYQEGMNLQQVLATAGVHKHAGVDHILLTRNGETQTLNLGDLQANIALNAGDRVEVPYMQQKSDRELLTIVVIGILLILLLR